MRDSASSLGVGPRCACSIGRNVYAPIFVSLAKENDILSPSKWASMRGHPGDAYDGCPRHDLVYQIVYLRAITYRLTYLDADVFSAIDEVTNTH